MGSPHDFDLASELAVEFLRTLGRVTDRSGVDRSYRHRRLDQHPGAVGADLAVFGAAMVGEDFLQLVSRPFGRSVRDALYAPREGS